MAAVAMTMVRRRHLEPGFLESVPAEKVLLIQRVFRGYKVRKERKKKEPIIEPEAMVRALDRQARERQGFKHLLVFGCYLLLFVLVVLSRSASSSRFHMETALVKALTGVSTPDGVDLYSVSSTDDIFALAEAMLVNFYSVGDGEEVIGMDQNPSREAFAIESAWELLAEEVEERIGRPATPQEKSAVVDRARALLPELREPGSEWGFSCIQELRDAGLPFQKHMVLNPAELAGWTLVMERFNVTGSMFPKLDTGSGEFLTYSRLTGAMVISMTRRTEADCDVGHHAAVFDSCWSHADADASEFRGGYSGTEYEVHPASNRYYDLMDLGTFGFGLRSSQCRMETLKQDKWLGSHTKDAKMSLSLINGNVGLLAKADMEFEFTLGGLVEPTLTVSSTIIPSHEVADLWTVPQFVLLLIFVLWTLVGLVLVLRDICRHTGTDSRGWQLVDVLLYLMFLASEGLNIALGLETNALQTKTPEEIMSADDPFDVLVDQSLRVDEIAELERVFKLISCFVYLLALLRLLKTFQFHDRLNVITKTLTVAASDLFHFCIIFMAVTALYAAIAITTFGSQLEEYHSFTKAYETFMRVLLGDFSYDALVLVAPIMGPIVFWSFVFVVFFILLNVFLSIVVDAYILVKEQSNDADGFIVSLVGAAMPFVARARLRLRLLVQDVPLCGRCVHRKLHPEAAHAISMRWGGKFRVGAEEGRRGSGPQLGIPHGAASGSGAGTATTGAHKAAAVVPVDAHAGDDLEAAPKMFQPGAANARLSHKYHAAHQFMTPRAQRLLPVMGAIYVPPRAEELAAPLRILADHKLHISTPEQPQRIDRFDVRRAIGVYFDKATVDDIMATFGQTPDVMRQAQEKQVQRNRAVQKEVLTSLRRITKKLDHGAELRGAVDRMAAQHSAGDAYASHHK